MTNPEHNNEPDKPALIIVTLGDLMTFTGGMDLPAERKAELRSAIQRADELVGHGALDLPADAVPLLKKLDLLSPAMAGMSPGGFANLRSRLRAVFRLATPHLERPRTRAKLTGVWAELYGKLDIGEQRNLSRFVYFAQAQGWQPSSISDAHLSRFGDYLRDVVLISTWEEVVRNSILAWNRLAAGAAGSGLSPLTPPVRKREPYWIASSGWPPGLREDVEAFSAELTKPSVFMEVSVRKLKPTTINQYRFTITTLVSAAVGAGVELGALKRLADAVAPDHVRRALEFLYARAGNRITSQMRILAARARIIAEWCKLPPEAIGDLGRISSSLRAHDRSRRGLTPKNRALLDRLDDERFSDLILLLPQMLMERARKTKNTRRASSLARSAMAVELLLTCSMRRENLVGLELDTSIRKVGQGAKAKWVIEIAGEQVKNGDPLRFILPPPTTELLEGYLVDQRPKLSAMPGSWLFPGPDGNRIDPRTMASAIERHARQVLGERITPHQFRHLSAELFLREQPEAILTVSEHLGHRDLNTTRWFYARSKQREASRCFQERVVFDRGAARRRIKIRKRHSLQPKTFDRRDEL
jgi:integrase